VDGPFSRFVIFGSRGKVATTMDDSHHPAGMLGEALLKHSRLSMNQSLKCYQQQAPTTNVTNEILMISNDRWFS
jgi:hypothetical protein